MRLIQSGPRNARIVVVGEAPGAKEDETGVPFAGESGRMVDSWLGKFGVSRSQVFVTNVCHARPPANEFSWFFKPKPKLEYVQGILQLHSDLSEIRPNVVLAFGAQALRALTGKSNIFNWRGSILESSLVPGVKVVPTLHPAFTFKGEGMYAYRYLIEFDVKRAVEEAAYPDLRLPKREIIINPTDEEMWRVANEMATARWLGTDIECFEREDGGWELACVGFSDRADRALVIPANTASRRNCIQYLLACPAGKVGQNFNNFDYFVLEDEGFTINNYEWDCMIGVHTIFPECASSEEETQKLTGKKKNSQPAFRKGLAWQTSVWTREPFYKEDGKLWKKTGDVDMFWRYNGKDACVQREIRDGQEKDLIEMGALDTFKESMSQVPANYKMARRGIPVDVVAHKELSTSIVKEIENLQNFLDAGAGWPVNVKSPDVGKLLFDQLKLPVKKRSAKTDKPSADKDVINELAQKNPHPLLMTILEIRERRDMKERYLDCKWDSDNRMRCTWDLTGTRSGRPAARASIYGTGTAITTVPPKMRRMYCCEPGHVMFSIDYSQAEARVVAWYAGCTGLIELFSDPTRDVHKENASRFYHIHLSTVTPEQRYLAKRVVHGSNYGMEYFRMWQVVNNDYRETGIRISLDQARLGQEMYFVTYPEIKNVYWREVRDELYATRTLVTALGRKRTFFGMWSDKFLNEGYSYKPQGTVGDMTRKAIRLVDERVPKAEAFINGYDSITGQCKIEDVEEVTAAVQECMRIPVTIKGRELIIPTDVKVGLNWGERSEKKQADGSIVVDNPNGLQKLDKWLKHMKEAA